MSSDPAAAHQSRHPTLKQYVAIAIFLFVVTLVEFVIILPPGWVPGDSQVRGGGLDACAFGDPVGDQVRGGHLFLYAPEV